MVTLIPPISVSTLTSPAMLSVSTKGLNPESVESSPIKLPSNGPNVNPPSPKMSYPSPLSVTLILIKNIPPGPSILPVRLTNLPFSTAPVIEIINPENSVLTFASPLIFNELGSILNAESVSMPALSVPSTGPAVNAPSPLIM